MKCVHCPNCDAAHLRCELGLQKIYYATQEVKCEAGEQALVSHAQRGEVYRSPVVWREPVAVRS